MSTDLRKDREEMVLSESKTQVLDPSVCVGGEYGTGGVATCKRALLSPTVAGTGEDSLRLRKAWKRDSLSSAGAGERNQQFPETLPGERRGGEKERQMEGEKEGGEEGDRAKSSLIFLAFLCLQCVTPLTGGQTRR